MLITSYHTVHVTEIVTYSVLVFSGWLGYWRVVNVTLCISCGLSSHCGSEVSKIRPKFLKLFDLVHRFNGYIHVYIFIGARKQRTDVGKYSFVNRTNKNWNQLPAGLLASFPM
jgi:hypothetical protein